VTGLGLAARWGGPGLRRGLERVQLVRAHNAVVLKHWLAGEVVLGERCGLVVTLAECGHQLDLPRREVREAAGPSRTRCNGAGRGGSVHLWGGAG
jgi:hypothetical protein